MFLFTVIYGLTVQVPFLTPVYLKHLAGKYKCGSVHFTLTLNITIKFK